MSKAQSKADKLDEIWKGDLLQRRKEADFLETFLRSVSVEQPRLGDRGSLVVNLKAPWGQGKSFFLARFARQLRENGHKVAELNAWRADPQIDPLVALMGAIEKEIQPELKKPGHRVTKAFNVAKGASGTIAKSALKSILIGLTKRAIGPAADELGDELQDLFAEQGLDTGDVIERAVEDGGKAAADEAEKIDLEIYQSSRFTKELRQVGKHEEAVQSFSKSISDIADAYAAKRGGSGPFYILVDELDRCRPTFAIEVLERINHLFDTRGVVFVIGTHSDELQNSINAVYGTNFNSSGYLNRFFDLTYNLATPGLSDWIDHLVHKFSLDLTKYLVPDCNTHKGILISLGSAANLSLRDYTQVFLLLRAVEMTWQHQAKLDLISLYAYAIAVHLKLDNCLDLPGFTPLGGSPDSAKDLSNSPINFRRKGEMRSITLSQYMGEMLSEGRRDVETATNNTHADGAHTIHSHRRSLLVSQMQGRATKHLYSERPLWGEYLALLRTARQIALPAEENA